MSSLLYKASWISSLTIDDMDLRSSVAKVANIPAVLLLIVTTSINIFVVDKVM
jgi:hypothetical protein